MTLKRTLGPNSSSGAIGFESHRPRSATLPPATRCGTIFLLASAILLLLSSFTPLLLLGNVEAQTTREVKGKVFYLHTLDETVNVAGVATQTVMNTTVGTSGQEITSVMRIIARWLIYPELASDLTLNGSANMTLWWRSSAAGEQASWTLTIREVFADGSSVDVASAEVTNSIGTAFEEDVVNVALDRTFAAGSTVEAHINVVGNSAVTYSIAWGNATRDSRVSLPAQDYVRIVPQGEGGIVTLDSDRNVQNNFDPNAENKTIYIQAKVTNPFGGYDVHWVNLTVEAPNGTIVTELNNLSMPQVSGFFNSFESVFEVSWNYSGYPEGRYNVTVYAMDKNGLRALETTGDFGGHLETEMGVFFIGALPIEVHILVVDRDNDTLAGAPVAILFGDTVQALGTTNASGRLEVDLAPGIYELEVRWKDTLVGSHELDATADIPFDDPFVAAAAVYDVVLRAVDSQGAGLSRAAMVVQFPNETVSDPPLVLDAEGNATLPDMPGGDYELTVLWSGKVVAARAFHIQASGTYLVAAAVYYVDFAAVDADANAVDNALITVSDPVSGTFVESRLTDAQGRLTSRTPLGDYSVAVTWFGISVFEGGSLNVSGDIQVTLSLSIFNQELVPVDSRGVPLEDASISVTAGGFTRVASTLTAGSVQLRMPMGDYRIEVVWRGVLVFDAIVGVDGTVASIQLDADVFYLQLAVKDASGAALAGAFVTVLRNGETVAAGTTGEAGQAEFRLPMGTYQVQVSYRTTYLLTDVSTGAEASTDLVQDQPLEVTLSAFPPPIYATILFYVLIAVAAIAAALVYVLLKVKEVI